MKPFEEYFNISRISSDELDGLITNLRQILDRKEDLLDFIREHNSQVNTRYIQ